MSNISSDQSNQIKSVIDQSRDILIALPKNPDIDTVAAGLSLYLSLSSTGKRVSIACSNQMTVEFNRLVGIDKISDNINGGTGKNLVISFPYQEGSIEKVSYNIENETFNLVIEPREGYPSVTPDLMRYSYNGGNTDTVICIGASGLEQLDSLYLNNQALFSNKPVINVDNSSQNSGFGKINIVYPDSSTVSELMVSVISMLGLSMDADIATNLYMGIAIGSQNFSSAKTGPSTFETAAICLRHGARKSSSVQENIPSSQNTPPPFNSFLKSQKPSYQMPKDQPLPLKTQSSPFRANPPLQPIPQPITQQQSKPHEDAPPDWLKPKIYKGSTLV